MPENRAAMWTLLVLALITVPTLAVGEAPTSPETESSPAEEIALLLEPPVETLCLATFCINVEVWAHNPETGECRSFPNPCSVPPGWEMGCP